MNDTYIVVDEFVVENVKVLALNKGINLHEDTSKIQIDDEVFPYGLTHNELWITVKTDKKLLGKEFVFVS